MHNRELFVIGVANSAAGEVTLRERELVESVESRSLSLSHSHLALGVGSQIGRGQEWMSGGRNQRGWGEQSQR